MSTIPRAITGISKADSALSAASQPPPVLSVPSDVPTSSASALHFLSKLNKTDLKYSIFDDELITFSENESEMGEYKVEVKQECYKGEDSICVHAKSDGKIDGVFCCTELTAHIGSHLETLHQDLYEIVKLDQGTLERHTILELTQEGLKATKTIKQSDSTERFEKLFEKNLVDGYISEGANILLQRILIVKGLPDYFDVVSFDADTNLCLCTYRDLATCELKISEQPVKCYGIARKIFSLTDIPVTWHSYFIPDGHLITRAQIGSPIVMKVTIVPELLQHDEYLEKPIATKEELKWQKDMQMISLFDDQKNELISNYQTYCRNNPELQALIADFLQSLLIHKPENTFDFAKQFFASFSNRFVIEPPIINRKKNQQSIMTSATTSNK